jgi:hypothetical protein
MRSRSIITTALVAGAALAIGAATGAPAKSAKKVAALTCGLEIFAQGPPQGTPPSGIQFGFADCPRPFGHGLHYDAYTVTPSGQGQGAIDGTFKNYYNRGTASGTFAITFSTSTENPANVTYTGTVAYTRGTGAFRRVRGGGTIMCTTTNGGARKSCTVNSRLTGS